MAYSASDFLLGWVWQENGQFDEITTHITKRENFDFSTKPLADIKSEIYGGNYVTLIDNDYPEFIRTGASKPPYCLFWKGDLGILSRNNAVTIVAYKTSVSDHINTYSKYALIQVIKKYAPNNDIIFSISDEYHDIAMQTFEKYKGPNSHSIEFIDMSLSDYELKYASSRQANLVVAYRFRTDRTIPNQMGIRTATITATKKLVVAECSSVSTPVLVLLTASEGNVETEVVPYPFFDGLHGNNKLIKQSFGEIMFLEEEN